MTSASILVVDEDASARLALARDLATDGYQVTQTGSRVGALQLLAARPAELVIADLNGQTLALLDGLRAGSEGVDPTTPVLALTRERGALARIRVLERGGDAVLTRPVAYLELRGHVRALLRRNSAPRTPQRISVGGLTIDRRSRRVDVDGRPLALSAKEFALLWALATDPGRVFGKPELLRDVWGIRDPLKTRTLDSHACRVRTKLAAAGVRMVINVWGVGYRLADDAQMHEAA